MNSKRSLALLLATGLAGLSGAAAAQEQPQPDGMAPPPRVTSGPRRRVRLKEALQLTAKQGPDVAAARAQAAIVEAGIRRAWPTRQPHLVATRQFGPTSAPSLLSPASPGPGSPPTPLTL